MQISDFSGGLNTRLAADKLGINEAQVYTNIDNSAASIRPIKGSTEVQDIDKYFTYYEAGEEFISSSSETSFVEYRDILYRTNLNSYPTKYNGTSTYRLGIVAPTNTLTLTDIGAGVLDGTYTYVYTYYNSSDGTESEPNKVSNEIVVNLKNITISGFIASSDPQVDFIRLYRVGGALTAYTLVTEKANDTSSYVDNNADIDVAGNHVLDSYTYKEAPNNLKYLTEAYAMLFGAVDDKLYYSDIGKPNIWPATNFLDFEGAITGIGPVQNGLLVFTKYKTYIITGNSPTTFSRYLLSSEQGCISHYTIQFTSNTLIWLSLDGLCTSAGGAIEVITLPKLGKVSLTGVNNAQVYDRAYYLSHDAGILIFDFRYNTIVRTMDTIVGWLGYFKDTLYSYNNAKLHSMFTGTNLTYTYKSPILTEGSYSNLKKFKDIYIKYNGDIIVLIYIDGVLVNTKVLTGNSCYDLKTISASNGYGMEIEITGTGEVSEIEFKALGRQNGR